MKWFVIILVTLLVYGYNSANKSRSQNDELPEPRRGQKGLVPYVLSFGFLGVLAGYFGAITNKNMGNVLPALGLVLGGGLGVAIGAILWDSFKRYDAKAETKGIFFCLALLLLAGFFVLMHFAQD